MKNKFFKNCLALFLITLIAGLSLAFVNEITKDPISKAENDAKLKAYNEVFENATFEELENMSELVESTVSDDTPAYVNEVLSAHDSDGRLVGYVMSATSPSGYGGDVKIAVGISVDDYITGFSVLANSETAGLGAKCTEDDFKNQFKNKSAAGIEFTKSGAAGDTEIDAISGATITTNAVTEAVNEALSLYNNELKEG